MDALKTIATIRSDFTTKFGIPRQSGLAAAQLSTIVFESEYRDENALRGLDGYSHIWLIWGFSEVKAERWSPMVKPPRLGGNKRMGVFATRSPYRPNPIGLSSVKLERIEKRQNLGTVLIVSGADLMDGTPIYDIKPYLSFTDSHPDAKNGFAGERLSYALKVEIPDESTIDIYLKEADTEFLAYLTVAIVPEHVEDLEADPVGTGPFHYVSRSPQENIVLEKFSDYWDTENQAYLDKVTFRIVKDSNAVVTNLKSGTLDMYARLSSTQTAQLAEDSDFTIYDGGMNLVQALYLNNAVEPLNNVKVRQALCYAANRQEVLDMIADGKGTIIGSSMFPAFGKYYVPELSERYNQDIEKAKELLKEAGYPDGFELTITVPNNYQQHIDTAQVLVEQLKAIGVTAKIQQVEWDSWLSDVYADRKFQSTVVGVDAAYLTGRALLERFTSTSSKNFINYSNEEYDTLYQQVKTSTDEEEQVELYKKMETLLCDDAANLYIEDMACEVALRSDFAGYRFYPLYVQDMAKIYKVK